MANVYRAADSEALRLAARQPDLIDVTVYDADDPISAGQRWESALLTLADSTQITVDLMDQQWSELTKAIEEQSNGETVKFGLNLDSPDYSNARLYDDLDVVITAGRAARLLEERAPEEMTYTDHRADNVRRAMRAADALSTYGLKYEPSDQDIATTLGDFVGDLLHYCDAVGVSLYDALRRGEGDYDAECKGAF